MAPIVFLIKERCGIYVVVTNGIDWQVAKINRRRATIDLWQSRWDRSTTGSETYVYFPDVQSRLNLNLDWNHYATQFLSGRGNFEAKLFKFWLKEDPWCTNCENEIEETAWHVFAKRPLDNDERLNIQHLTTLVRRICPTKKGRNDQTMLSRICYNCPESWKEKRG